MKNLIPVLLVISSFVTFSSQVSDAETHALIDLFYSTNGPVWKNNTKWTIGDPCIESWYGVTCTNNNIDILDLHNNTLVGTIPATFGNLINLEFLYLDNNQLYGSLPSTLINISTIFQVVLSGNQFSGTIPPSYGSLNVAFFSLNNNNLTGTIPFTLGNLKVSLLDLSANYLTGSLPPSLGNLQRASELRLQNNYLTGILPATFGNLTNLSNLDISHNYLTGTIPDAFEKLFSNVDLSYNKLKGPLPSFLQNPPILGYILKHNDIQCPLPSWCDRPPIGNGDCTPCVPAAVTNQSCCFAHLDPGCADKGIEQCVCLKEPLCCSATSSWNQNCVNLVTQTGCGNCLTGSCCIPHYGFGCTNRNTSSCVCDTQPLCCTKQWSSICVELAYNRCGDCLSQVSGKDLCWVPHSTPGCYNATEATCVCKLDPYCCIVEWDDTCVATAKKYGCLFDSKQQ